MRLAVLPRETSARAGSGRSPARDRHTAPTPLVSGALESERPESTVELPGVVTTLVHENAAVADDTLVGAVRTPEAMVAEAPKKEAPAGGHGGHDHGGGMGGMDF